jgi:hypothetical protein
MKKLLLILALIASPSLFAQNIAEEKIKGEVWQKIESENFLFFFKQPQLDAAKNLMARAEKSYQYSSDLLGFLPSEKLAIFIHENPPKKEMPAVNVILNEDNFREKMELAINVAFLEDMMGKKVFKKLPEWFTNGAAAFATYSENKVDNATANLQELDRLDGKAAMETGVQVWQYISQNHGKEDIANLLNLSRILEDVEAGISQLWGISYQEFINSLTRYYNSQS